MRTKPSPHAIVKLLRRRRQYEDELIAMGKDEKVVRAVTRPNASNRGGSWKQQITYNMMLIDKIDKLLESDRIKLPKPVKWWEHT